MACCCSVRALHTHAMHMLRIAKRAISVADFSDTMISMKIILYPSNETEEFLFNEECTIEEVHRNITELLQDTRSRSLDPNNFRVWQINPLRELSKPLLTLRQMQVPRECSVLVTPPDVSPPPLSNNFQLDLTLSLSLLYTPNLDLIWQIHFLREFSKPLLTTSSDLHSISSVLAITQKTDPTKLQQTTMHLTKTVTRLLVCQLFDKKKFFSAPDIPETKITLKIIVFPANKTDEFLFDEEDTIQKVHKHIAELLQMHPQRELSKPLLTLRQMQIPRECLVVVVPPDVKPPLISNEDQLDQILSAFNSHSSRNNADNILNQVPAGNDAPNHGNQTKSEESAPKEEGTRKRKPRTKKVDLIDEPFLEFKQFSCKICLRSFGSVGAVRTHLTRIHKTSKKATEKARPVQRVKAVKRNEQPKKKAKENKNININITLNNTTNNVKNDELGREKIRYDERSEEWLVLIVITTHEPSERSERAAAAAGEVPEPIWRRFHDMPRNFMICLNWPNHEMAALHDMPRNFMICLNVTRQIVKRAFGKTIIAKKNAQQEAWEKRKTVRRWIQRYQATGDVKCDRQGPRPVAYTDESERHRNIVQVHSVAPFKSTRSSYWGWMSSMGPGELVEIGGRMNSERYLEVLKDVMLPSVRVAYPEGQIYLVHDNSSVHKSKIVKDWLNSQKDITVFEWPAKSPDLNPIENLWGQMVLNWDSIISGVHTYNPDTENVYHLFSRQNPTVSQPMLLGVPSLVATNFNALRPTVIILHGWSSGPTSPFNLHLIPNGVAI
ncbi:hypothetical protein MSG28_016034 [Choristoneura fumiferana]|uniref:Uncharacterized protein n=1 Tax=Choristoneura fumiferana TaxID=7141 RepID=A0ACC0K699_CHOFU|nr:hypothetical protein MSG28_016034 [Choristoneura fumiferana]